MSEVLKALRDQNAVTTQGILIFDSQKTSPLDNFLTNNDKCNVI